MRRSRHTALPPDTTREAFAVQLGLLRAAGPKARLDRAMSLSRFAIAASREALRRRHPDESETDLALRWVHQHYGEAACEGVREALARRG